MKRVCSVIAASVLVGATWLLTFGQEDVPTPQQNARGSAQAPATKVIFGEAVKSSYLEEYRAIGTARAVQSVAVVADVAGRIESMPNRGSAQIEAGKPLLTLERNVQRINVDIAETRLQQARETVERYRLLQSNGAATVSGVTVHEAATTMAIAAAELELAREEYDRRVIRAPISGQLG